MDVNKTLDEMQTMAKLKLPQSYGEREMLAKYIRKTLNTYNLRNNWLIQQLRNEGFIISATSLCDALAVRCMTPKTDEFLARAEQICKLYEQSYFGQNAIRELGKRVRAFMKEQPDIYERIYRETYGRAPNF